MPGIGIRPWPTRKQAGANANGCHRPAPRPNGSEPQSVWRVGPPQVGLTFPDAAGQTPLAQERQAAYLPGANVLAAPRHSNATRGIAAKPGNGRAKLPPLATIPRESFHANPSG